MQSKNVVLVAGVHGVSGRAAAQRWTTVPGTTVYGLSRRPDTPTPGVIPVLLDLLDRSTLAEKLKDAKDVTHIVFGAYAARATAAENVEANVAILENLLDVVETASPSLRHITFSRAEKLMEPTWVRSKRPQEKTICALCLRTSTTRRRIYCAHGRKAGSGIGLRFGRKGSLALGWVTR